MILGLGGLDHNGSLSVVDRGEVACFLEVERITRLKNQGIDGPEALRVALDRVEIGEVEHVAIADRTWFRRHQGWLERWLADRFPAARITAHHHHACHLATTFVSSGFERATVVSIDGKGDGLSAAFGLADRSSPPRVLGAVPSASSLGRLWWAASEYAGLPGHHAAGKTMALAGYGAPRFLADLTRHIAWATDGGFRFVPHDEHPDLFRQVPRLVAWMVRIADAPPATGAPGDAHRDMAASVQRLTEDLVARFVAAAVQVTGERRVCLSGGVALNGLVNHLLLRQGVVESLYVPPCCDDRGLSLGAAALAAVARGGPIRAVSEGISPFLGPAPRPWSGGDGAFCRRVREGEAPLQEVVARLLRGEIVGWFEGRDEAGPRALGHRSILATPTIPGVRERLNERIKQREPWRPFGCSILRDEVSRWFVCHDDSPYMLRIAEALPGVRDRISAALHVDGTSRLHSVDSDRSPRLAALLARLVASGHPPLLVNTSMNARGEPIVHTAEQAFAFARTSGLDALVVEGDLYTRVEAT